MALQVPLLISCLDEESTTTPSPLHSAALQLLLESGPKHPGVCAISL